MPLNGNNISWKSDSVDVVAYTQYGCLLYTNIKGLYFNHVKVLLSLLVNKIGDPDKKVASKAVDLLRRLGEIYMCSSKETISQCNVDQRYLFIIKIKNPPSFALSKPA